MTRQQTNYGAIVGSVLLGPVWIFLDDSPHNVGPGEPPLRSLIAWCWASFHVIGSVLAAFISPTWGLLWGLAAGVALARRICATGQYAVGLPVSYLVREVAALPCRAGVAVLVVAVNAPLKIAVPMPGILGDLQGLLGMLTGVMSVGLMGWAGVRLRARHVATTRAHEIWVPTLATIFGVAPSVIAEQAGLYPQPDGGIIVQPVPPAIAVKLGNWAAIEAAVANVAPHLTLAGGANAERLDLVPVTPAIAQQRAALAASGGLLAGVVAAPQRETIPADLRATLSLRLTEDDLR